MTFTWSHSFHFIFEKCLREKQLFGEESGVAADFIAELVFAWVDFKWTVVVFKYFFNSTAEILTFRSRSSSSHFTNSFRKLIIAECLIRLYFCIRQPKNAFAVIQTCLRIHILSRRNPILFPSLRTSLFGIEWFHNNGNRKRLRYQKDVSFGNRPDGVCIVASDIGAAGNPWNWVLSLFGWKSIDDNERQ